MVAFTTKSSLKVRLLCHLIYLLLWWWSFLFPFCHHKTDPRKMKTFSAINDNKLDNSITLHLRIQSFDCYMYILVMQESHSSNCNENHNLLQKPTFDSSTLTGCKNPTVWMIRRWKTGLFLHLSEYRHLLPTGIFETLRILT